MRRAAGFTLVELVMVIVLLAIVATISVQFVALSTRGAIDVSARQQRALQGVVISEQITRELREAFPLSIRTAGNCLEWLPILAGTAYTSLPRGASSDEISVAPFVDAPPAGTTRAIVYGYGTSTDSLYGDADPGPVSPPISSIDNSTSPAVITLSESHRFRERSPQRRLFVVGQPVSLCQSGRFLYRYGGYAPGSSQPTPPGVSPEVLAADLTGNVQFQYTPPSLRRAAVVQFTFTLKDPQGDETTTISQEVQIRNVP
ncbi:MSHA biogenesis protein MshO [Marinobacter daqiaonensis]|uniref:MSHA biogenesis protein MshO n=1 Tax=Marinobacter daqiaonensis TaxID=650891 RepID=A0A1I6K1D5_9GAMM|nr:type II secretion system protein [Marinobacter daqiaonensis]SFR85062.1 MSHA biogenesis protein MshO [Marinobacter daqiaonensis]